MARIRTTHGFLSLLILLILSSLCFLLLVDLHTRFSMQQPAAGVDMIADGDLSPARESLLDSNSLAQHSHPLQTNIADGSLLPAEYKVKFANKFWSSIQSIPWFMKGGNLRPVSSLSNIYSSLPIFPNEDPDSDRIVNQLMYIPPDYPAVLAKNHLKKIFLVNGFYSWSSNEVPLGQDRFLRDKCPVNTCTITIDPNEGNLADAVLFKNHFSEVAITRTYKQVWILYLLESPSHSPEFRNLNGLINWTATYRSDSDIVTPYEKLFQLSSPHFTDTSNTKNWPPFNNLQDNGGLNYEQIKAKFKTKANSVAWFVSNCSPNNLRTEYAKELSKYITVDIYGSCGTKICPRKKSRQCFGLLSSGYKFYLSFENSNCKDYVTEKFFINGLMNDVIPIVMGARKEDYIKTSPPGSFIHVDDFASPEQLARYLHMLAKNEQLYLSYFKWKSNPNWQLINTFFWCRLCAMLHSPYATQESHSYPSIRQWWSGPGVCNRDGWKSSTHNFVHN